MKYTTKINYGEWKDGDIICFPSYSFRNQPQHEMVCEVKNSKIYELPDMVEVVPNKNWKCIRIDYKFISDGTWYVEGKEAYPVAEIDTEENYWGAPFVGWTDEPYEGYEGKLPRWDGEICSLDEFKIEKR